MQTPILTTPPPLASVGNASAHIAVAVLALAEPMTSLFSLSICNALGAGLSRDSVPDIEHCCMFTSVFSVTLLTVPWAYRGESMASVKNVLKEMALLDLATIANRTADGSWLSIHGLDLGGISFEKAFLRPEYFEQSEADFEKLAARLVVMRGLFIEQLKARPAAESENSESK